MKTKKPGQINRRNKNADIALYSSDFPGNFADTAFLTCPQITRSGLTSYIMNKGLLQWNIGT